MRLKSTILKGYWSIAVLIIGGLISDIYAQSFDKELHKLQMTYQLVNTFYVDTVDQGQMVEEAIVGMLKSLDPHSVYISADEVAAMNEPLDGSFQGIGIQFNILNDTLMVVSPIIGGPSEKVGILAGDRIVNVDGKNVAGIGLKNSEVFKMLRGEKGTKVKLQINRKSEQEVLSFVVVRDKIPIHSVESAYMATPQTGYVKITRFAANTHDEFLEALDQLEKENYKNLILDLRGNTGGYLKAAIDIADELIDSDRLLVYTQGVNSVRRDHNANRRGEFEKGNLVVLMDEGSASASEIVAGAIQDWDRGIVIGRRSYGKGLVQRPFALPDGSMIRLTIAQYYTPSGRCIQKEYTNGADAYHHEIVDRYMHGEMSNMDSIQFDDTMKYTTLLSGRTVYGGGGIMPDVFIPIDTTLYSDYYRDLVASGVVNRSILSFVDEYRDQLKAQYVTFEQFDQRFSVSDELIDRLVSEGEKQDISKNDEELKLSEKLMKVQLKALIARDLFDTSEYFETINTLSEAYLKAIELVETKKEYTQLLK